MTKFLSLKNGRRISLRRVGAIRLKNNDEYGVYGLDDEHLGDAIEYDVTMATAVIVAAPAGWRVINWLKPDLHDPEDEFHSFAEAVIAWDMSRDPPLPLTGAGNLHREMNPYLLVSPEELVTSHDGDSWESVEDALKSARAEWERWRTELMLKAKRAERQPEESNVSDSTPTLPR